MVAMKYKRTVAWVSLEIGGVKEPTGSEEMQDMHPELSSTYTSQVVMQKMLRTRRRGLIIRKFAV